MLSCAAVAAGDVVVDPTGDIATGNPNLDLTAVSITDDGTDVFLSITVDNLDGDWGKYMLFLDFDGDAVGSGDNDNPWGRNVSGLMGTDTFVGIWLDGGGGVDIQDYNAGGWWEGSSGSVWASMSVDWAANAINLTFHNAVTGSIADGYTGFDIEVATTGGNWGDPAIDLLGEEGTQDGWGGGSHSTEQYHYTFSVVPAPSALALLAIAGVCRRRRR
ncbi:MAG: hypothetical protein MK101_06190 [Phycisphaerales bacterium]|nr:hypothetical protein [Phycisphaerales bacterium]